MYEKNSPSCSVVKDWSKQFWIEYKPLENDARIGRAVEIMTHDNIALVEDHLGMSKVKLVHSGSSNIFQQFNSVIVLNIFYPFWSSVKKTLWTCWRRWSQGMKLWFVAMILCRRSRWNGDEREKHYQKSSVSVRLLKRWQLRSFAIVGAFYLWPSSLAFIMQHFCTNNDIIFGTKDVKNWLKASICFTTMQMYTLLELHKPQLMTAILND